MKKKVMKNGHRLEDTLKARGTTYGDFTDNSAVAQALKEVIHAAPGYHRLRPVHREALDVMASKISRIVTGDPEYSDNWQDIAGYAKITEDRCK